MYYYSFMIFYPFSKKIFGKCYEKHLYVCNYLPHSHLKTNNFVTNYGKTKSLYTGRLLHVGSIQDHI